MSRLGIESGFALPGRDDDDEGLFSRDLDGQLVRLDNPTENDYEKSVSLQIDGQSVAVPLAQPQKDAQGNIILDQDGRTTPRYTTIFDAACQLMESNPAKGKNPIPTLCHLPHMTPVAVCRLCTVQIYGTKRGKRAPERKLLPACQHQVKDGMEVFTMFAEGPDGDRVRRNVRVLSDLLAVDHLKPAPLPELSPFNELQLIADKCGGNGSRFQLDVLTQPGASNRKRLDDSSPVFAVDHSACILCDRCSRACDEIKKNDVIGRTGKGPSTRIGFDLDLPMGESGCVQCGECMVSCPTTAITFKPVARVNVTSDSRDRKHISAAELLREPSFDGIPPKFLLWQEGLVVRRQVKPGEFLCRQGEPGTTAFLIKSGKFEVRYWPRNRQIDRSATKTTEPSMRNMHTAQDFMLGEMACLSGTPRNADIAVVESGEVWEVRRNVLDRMMRSPALRGRFETVYRARALDATLYSADLFRDLPVDEFRSLVDFLRPRISFVRVSPGQVIFKLGAWADALYLVRLGHVRVGIGQDGREIHVRYSGPGSVIGEIGLLAISPEDEKKTIDQINRELELMLQGCANENLSSNLPAGRRTATCSALDHLELARVGRSDFLQLVRDFPNLRSRLVELSLGRLANIQADSEERGTYRQYIEQGLYQGQSLLVLDLDRCTRCGECVRACVQQHGTESHGAPISRLLLEGRRFGDHLVATSCRSCKDAYCMIGCPVDAIHRGKHQQIVIEDHCIGCGLCSTNCPYDNIWMVPNEGRKLEMADPQSPGKTISVAQLKAATCDLCDTEGAENQPLPRCVNACPHDAAHRMSGETLFKIVADSKSDSIST